MSAIAGHLGIVHLGIFCVAVLLLNLTPGPDTAFIVGQSVAHGRRAGLLSVIGISAGCGVHTLALALGLSALLAASANAFTIIKIVGAGYLIFLGLRMLIGTLRTKAPLKDGPPVAEAQFSTHEARSPDTLVAQTEPSGRRIFVQGFVTNVLNPKVVLFFLSFFPQFVSSDSASKGLAFAFLGGVLIVISTLYNGTVAWLAGGITHRMRGAPRVKAWLERSVGAAFVALGARLALSEH